MEYHGPFSRMRFTIDWKTGEVVPFSAEAHEEDRDDHDHDEHEDHEEDHDHDEHDHGDEDHEGGEVTVSIEDIAAEIAAPNSGSSSVEVESDGSGAAGNNAGFFILSLLLMAACAM